VDVVEAVEGEFFLDTAYCSDESGFAGVVLYGKGTADSATAVVSTVFER